MVKVPGSRFQPVGDVSHGIAPGKLTEYHADELAPGVVALTVIVRSRLFDDSPNLFFGQLRDYLRE